MVEIKNLVKTFSDIRAVDNLTLTVNRGEIFGLLGLNGAGKSTTMRCMLNLIKPDAGEMFFFGMNMTGNRNLVLSKIGCLIEKPDHYNYLTARQNVILSARLYGRNPEKKEIESVFELVGLQGKENQKVKTFSQGMKQRLGIANTLIHDPELIILDEPTNGLDPQGIIDLRNLILKLKNERNKTIILSSHILSEIEMIADSIAIIYKGKNMIAGKMNELLSGNEVVIDIESNSSEKILKKISDAHFIQSINKIDDQKLSVKIEKEHLSIMHKMIAETDAIVYHFNTRNKLEDYFLKLTHFNEQPVFHN